jgi:chemotaxis signal transduction protein
VELEQASAAALLDRRTTELATRPERAAQARPRAPVSLIIWGLGDSLFGTEVGAVAAVIPFGGCARVPTREAACLGVLGRSGRFYSVIGMRRLLGMDAAEAPPGHLLLLRGAAPYLAMAVDRVLGRFDLAAPGLGAAPASSSAISFQGRLVAPFALAELRNRLGPSSFAAIPLEAMPS